MPRLRLALFVFFLLAALIVNAPWITQRLYSLYYERSVGRLPTLALPGPGERILILSPHPDDESLCCGGFIHKALAQGSGAYVVWLTSGDGFEWDAALLDRTPHPSALDLQDLALRRMAEARRAASTLGLDPKHLFFLCYPDRGLLHLFLEHYRTPYTSPYTHLAQVSYPGCLTPGAPYTGQALEADLQRVVAQVRPTLLLAPFPLDAHADHRATAYLALRLLRPGLPGLFWVVHGGLEWPLPKGFHPGLPLEPPPRGRGLPWQRLDLDPSDETVKQAALLAYQSQMEILGRFLLAFVRRSELFSPLPLPTHP